MHGYIRNKKRVFSSAITGQTSIPMGVMSVYGAWGDGDGFGGTNGRGRVGIGFARIEGNPENYRGYNVWGGFEAENPATFDGKSWATISIEGVLYMWVVPDNPEAKSYRNHYEYIELAQSLDKGASWTKANWKFLENESLTIPIFLNFGKDNAGVPKGVIKSAVII